MAEVVAAVEAALVNVLADAARVVAVPAKVRFAVAKIMVMVTKAVAV